MRSVEFINWGQISYTQAWTQQKELLKQRQEDAIPDLFIFCQHEAVVTVGKSKEKEGQLKNNLELCPYPVQHIERGGLATYHGPGQLICYPIVKLASQKESAFSGVVDLIRKLELALINFLKDHNIQATCQKGNTGVWVNDKRKIASVGVAVSHWVSYHGLSLNLSTGKEPWKFINPCGFDSAVMTDLEIESGTKVSFNDAVSKLTKEFSAFYE